MTATVDDAMKSLYEVAQGTYVTRPYATISRTFKINPMLAPQKPEFKPDPLLMAPPPGYDPDSSDFQSVAMTTSAKAAK